ncbi:MAG: malto-oligosyltrehalose trehalohydrolase [Gammaproteobacteria bacterium]|nr:MAG: malto-oligosyltrehalose trehalohydrolase [Gammaproteobacteria bacterium]
MSLPEERHGAFPNKDNTTRFAIWAPDALRVTIKLGDGRRFDLIKSLDGWHWINIECGPGTQYTYIIDNDLEVPDPASRGQVSDVHSPSYVVDQNYPWKCVTWHGRPWHETVIYELHVGLFGGYKKVEEYLPQLVELGITAIELMPLSEFPGARNWGYDGVLPFAPEASYGTPDELKSLIDTAHDLNLMVFIDVVYNHFGPDGNYLGHYAKGFFRDDIKTPWGSAIDFRRSQVRDYFCENALMWVVDYRADGLRFDAVHAISEKDFLVELAERVRDAILPSRHVHLMLENEDNNANLLENGFDAQWNDDGHNILHHIITGEKEGYYENFSDVPTTKLARCFSEGFIYQGQLTRKGTPRGTLSGHLPPTSFILFLQNHDQVGNRAFGERLPLLADNEDLKIAVALMLLCPMIPLLFMGEEWGSQQPFLFFTDHNEELSKLVCEGRRKEFADFAIFSDGESLEKIPDPNALTTFTNSALNHELHNAPEHQDWWNFYKSLLQLRTTELTPQLPGSFSLGTHALAEKAICAAWTLGSGDVWRIYINFSAEEVTATPTWSGSKLIFDYGLDKSKYEAGQLPGKSILVSVTTAENRNS